jgi:hypothetical protein
MTIAAKEGMIETSFFYGLTVLLACSRRDTTAEGKPPEGASR